MTNSSGYRLYGERQFAPLKNRPKKRFFYKAIIVLAVLIIAVVLTYASDPSLLTRKVDHGSSGHKVQAKTPVAKASKPNPASSTVSNGYAQKDMCTGNDLSQLIVVSISQRHMWACNNSKLLYSSPVVTGMENLAADLTPTGTYHIYSKRTDTYLKGSDSTGSWDDFVNYWMPFLDNQYGIYGFHDATWRPANAFGNISPYSSNASHGCVELPLATAKWLYGWAQIGTTLTIES